MSNNKGNTGNSKPNKKKEGTFFGSISKSASDAEGLIKGVGKTAESVIKKASGLGTTGIKKLTDSVSKLSLTMSDVEKALDGFDTASIEKATEILNALADANKSQDVPSGQNKRRSAFDKLVSDAKEARDFQKSQPTRTKAGQKRVDEILSARKKYEDTMGDIFKDFTGNEEGEDLEKLQKSIGDAIGGLEEAENKQVPAMEKIADTAIKALQKILNDFIKYFTDNVSKGIEDAFNWNIANYTELAGKTGSAGDTIDSIKQLVSDYRKTDFGKGLNITNELKPMFLELAKQGLQGENLRETAITNAVDKKIMPWLDNTSQNWITLTKALGDTKTSILKGQQLSLRESEAGNRLLQTGVITQLTQQMTPLLQTISDSAFASQYTEEIYSLAQQLVDNGMSPEQAQQYAQKVLQVQMNPYQAITSGNTAEMLMAMNYGRGMNAIEIVQDELNRLGRYTGTNIFSASAGANIMGSGILPQTREGNMFAGRIGSKLKVDIDNQINYEKYYLGIQETLGDYTSKSEKFQNSIQNFFSGIGDTYSGWTMGQLATNLTSSAINSIPSLVSGIVGGVLGGKVLGKLGGKLGGNLLSKLGGSGLNIFKSVSGGGGSNPLEISTTSRIGNLFGLEKGAGLKNFSNFFSKSGGNILWTKGARIAGGAGGAIALGADLIGGISRNKKAGYSGGKLAGYSVLDMLTGTTDEISFGNVLGQTAKYAGIGTAIGGPIGTAIGAGVGILASTLGVAIKKSIKEKDGAGASGGGGGNAVEQMAGSSLEETSPIITYLNSINDNLTNGRARVVIVEDTFSDSKNDTSKNIIDTDISTSSTKDETTYREQLLDRISSVGEEIVKAINGTKTNDNIEKDYFFNRINKTTEFSKSLSEASSLTSDNGVTKTGK